MKTIFKPPYFNNFQQSTLKFVKFNLQHVQSYSGTAWWNSYKGHSRSTTLCSYFRHVWNIWSLLNHSRSFWGFILNQFRAILDEWIKIFLYSFITCSLIGIKWNFGRQRLKQKSMKLFQSIKLSFDRTSVYLVFDAFKVLQQWALVQ